ncbi:cytochrome c [Flavihumibacter sp. R14]|nr:cytochrome c [Flavihumibacter soli]
MKKLLCLSALVLFVAACAGSGDGTGSDTTSAATSETTEGGNPSYDPNRGEGKFTNVEVKPNLDAGMAEKGEKVADLKCTSCHKMTDERLVGPGWAGVTTRHAPEWIMNFMTNTDVMIDKDPKAQAMLEICMVRMPNQNLSDDDARNVYEYMRKVDGVK